MKPGQLGSAPVGRAVGITEPGAIVRSCPGRPGQMPNFTNQSRAPSRSLHQCAQIEISQGGGPSTIGSVLGLFQSKVKVSDPSSGLSSPHVNADHLSSRLETLPRLGGALLSFISSSDTGRMLRILPQWVTVILVVAVKCVQHLVVRRAWAGPQQSLAE